MILKHFKQNISSIGARHQCTRAPSVRDSPTPWEAKSAEGQAISYNKLYTLATAYRPLLVWPLKTKATGTGNESTAGQPNDDSNVSARQRQGN